MDFPDASGLQLSRTDFAPDGTRAALFGLQLTQPGRRQDRHGQGRRALRADGALPVGVDDAERGRRNARRHRRVRRTARSCSATGHRRRRGRTTTPRPSARPRRPTAARPAPATAARSPATVCTDRDEHAERLRRRPVRQGHRRRSCATRSRCPAHGAQTLWIARRRLRPGHRRRARGARRRARRPRRRARRQDRRARAARRATRSSTCRATGGCRRASTGASRTSPTSRRRATNLKIRFVDQGKAYPPPVGTVPQRDARSAPATRTTRGSSPPTASTRRSRAVARRPVRGDQGPPARAARRLATIVNGRSGKVAHEIVTDGSVYFGAQHRPGQHRRDGKFPSAVALVWRWTGDDRFRDDLYDFSVAQPALRRRAARRRRRRLARGPRQRRAHRHGRGEARQHRLLRSAASTTSPTWRRPSTTRATEQWARGWRDQLRAGSRTPGGTRRRRQYADSLDDPGNEQIQQKHWIGVTPMEAELTLDGQAAARPRAARRTAPPRWPGARATASAARAPFNHGLFHTGCGGGAGAARASGRSSR